MGIIILTGISEGMGCDICGCSSSISMLGLLPQFSNNYASVRWRYVRFNASESLNNGQDHFHQIETKVGFRLMKKINIQAVIPYTFNRHVSPVEHTRYQGIGDATVTADFITLNTTDSLNHSFIHYLAVGGGIKLPTGKFESGSPEGVMPANFQLGSGSIDYLLRLMYTVRHTTWGASLDLSGRFNTVNQDDYLFGDQWGGSLSISYLTPPTMVSLMPYVGLFGEHIGKNRSERHYQPGTGGKGIYLMGGMETRIGRMMVGINYQHPLATSYADQEIKGGNRMTTHLSFLF